MEALDFSHLYITFFNDTHLNKRESEIAKRAIYDDVEKIKIQIAGDKLSVLVAPVNDQSSVRDPETGQRLTYKQLHAERYKAWKKGQEYIDGTPLEVAPFISKGKVAELKALNVHSLEQLAKMDGTALEKLGMGHRKLKEQAEAYLDENSKSADVVALAGENEDLKERIATLEAMMQQGSAQAPAESTDETIPDNPFNDMDRDTIEVWMNENGGSFDQRWSESTARLKALEHNKHLEKQTEAA